MMMSIQQCSSLFLHNDYDDYDDYVGYDDYNDYDDYDDYDGRCSVLPPPPD